MSATATDPQIPPEVREMVESRAALVQELGQAMVNALQGAQPSQVAMNAFIQAKVSQAMITALLMYLGKDGGTEHLEIDALVNQCIAAEITRWTPQMARILVPGHLNGG